MIKMKLKTLIEDRILKYNNIKYVSIKFIQERLISSNIDALQGCVNINEDGSRVKFSGIGCYWVSTPGYIGWNLV